MLSFEGPFVRCGVIALGYVPWSVISQSPPTSRLVGDLHGACKTPT